MIVHELLVATLQQLGCLEPGMLLDVGDTVWVHWIVRVLGSVYFLLTPQGK